MSPLAQAILAVAVGDQQIYTIACPQDVQISTVCCIRALMSRAKLKNKKSAFERRRDSPKYDFKSILPLRTSLSVGHNMHSPLLFVKIYHILILTCPNVNKKVLLKYRKIMPRLIKVKPTRNTTTIHKDVTERLAKINPNLASRARAVLEINKSERHIRGGLATKEKYMSISGTRTMKKF